MEYEKGGTNLFCSSASSEDRTSFDESTLAEHCSTVVSKKSPILIFHNSDIYKDYCSLVLVYKFLKTWKRWSDYEDRPRF